MKTRRLVNRLLPAVLVLLLIAPAAAAPLAPHLDIINMDLVLADARFSGLTGTGQTIAVLDTGVDTLHLLVTPRVGSGSNEASDTPGGLSPNYSDWYGHGTFVASVAGGNDNYVVNPGSGDIQLSGVARNVGLSSVRVLSKTGSGSFFDILDGLIWVRDNAATYNITVVNMSLGTDSTFVDPDELLNNSALAQDFSDAVDELRAMGILVVAASGNSGSQTGLSFPAILDNVLSVGATDLSDNVASFTNRSNRLDMLAPGVDIWGAHFAFSQPNTHNLVAEGDGTSFAAPQVSGAAVLIRELFEQRAGRAPTPDEIKQILQDSGVTITEGADSWQRLDLYAALEMTYAVPEPGSVLLLVTGAGVLLLAARRRLQASRVAA